jgi:hypothetical protein
MLRGEEMKGKIPKIFGSLLLIIAILIAGVYNGFLNPSVSITINERASQQMTQEQKIQDFNYFYNIVKENFPYFELKKRVFEYDWLAQKSEFEEWIRNTNSDIEFYNTMNRIVTLIQNAHTNLLDYWYWRYLKNAYEIGLPNPRSQVLSNKYVERAYSYWGNMIKEDRYFIPITFVYVEGKYVASNIEDIEELGNNEIPEGSILLKVDSINIDKYIKSLKDSAYLTYDFKWDKIKLNKLLIQTNKDEGKELVLLTPEGETIQKHIRGGKYEASNLGNTSSENILMTKLNDKGIAYLKVKSFGSEYVKKDGTKIYSFLKGIENYPYLIIDIRGNGGGNELYYMKNIVAPLTNKKLRADFNIIYRDGGYGKPFIKSKGEPFIKNVTVKSTVNLPPGKSYPPELLDDFGYYSKAHRTVKPKNSIEFKGKIYLLIDDYVYSSAETFAAFCKETGWATLVGTTSGGDGIGVDPAFMVLPNSGLVIRFPIDMGLNADGTANEETHTKPDIYIEQSYSDFVEGLKWQRDNADSEDINPYDTILNKVIKEIICDDNKST